MDNIIRKINTNCRLYYDRVCIKVPADAYNNVWNNVTTKVNNVVYYQITINIYNNLGMEISNGKPRS